MSSAEDTKNTLSETLRSAWHRFSGDYESLRPELYRYCRHLTRSPWDAEDLCQDALSRAFVSLGRMTGAPPNPKAWLFRVASNLWIDETRRRREPPETPPEAAASTDPRESREAGGTLIGRLSPQERVAVVLKDVFDFSLEETAQVLATSTGAVKAALHRARGKLVEPEPEVVRTPDLAVLGAFVDAFNARDLERLTALLLESTSIEVVGTHTEFGPDAAKRGVFHGMLYGVERLAAADTRGGIEARYVQGALPVPPRAELRVHRGEPLVLLWYAHEDGEAVRAVNRIETTDGGRIRRLQNYFFTSDFIREVCTELGVPFRINGYRYWLSGC